jgi:hypothetical protein
VTVSPSFITPLVTPPIARSPDSLVEANAPVTNAVQLNPPPAMGM